MNSGGEGVRGGRETPKQHHRVVYTRVLQVMIVRGNTDHCCKGEVRDGKQGW